MTNQRSVIDLTEPPHPGENLLHFTSLCYFMGFLRFIVDSPRQRIDPVLPSIYAIGFDRSPWQTEVRWEGELLCCEWDLSDSASIYVPWNVPGVGWRTLGTGSLLQRQMPYRLEVELTRGKLVQVRNQLGEWEQYGLAVPEALTAALREAVTLFGQIATGNEAPIEQAMQSACEVADGLGNTFVEQALDVRLRQKGPRKCFLGADLGTTTFEPRSSNAYHKAFNAANVPIIWGKIESHEGNTDWTAPDEQIQWCLDRRLVVCSGPILSFDNNYLPDWLYLYENDYDSISYSARQFTAQVVKRYRGKVDLWQCAGRLQTPGVLSLDEGQRVRLAVELLSVVAEQDPDTPRTLSFDQPWAEFNNHREVDFTPLHVANEIVRSGSPINGVFLEINHSYCPEGTLPRDLIDLNRQLDFWNLLGIPLYVKLTAPSSLTDDPQARRKSVPLSAADSPETQASFAKRWVGLLTARLAVHGILWNQLFDSAPHDFANGGLFDHEGRPKPILDVLTELRTTHMSKK